MHAITHLWLDLLIQLVCGFGCAMFFGIGQGPSTQEKDMFNLLTTTAGFEKKQGQGDITKSDTYWFDILSGDPTKMATAIAPEASVIQGQAQQQKNQLAESGTRSGGTTAKAAGIDSAAHGEIQNLLNKLRPQAAGQLGAHGMGLLGEAGSTGTSAFGAAKTMQEQNAAMWNDIFKSIAQVVSGVAGMGGGGAAAGGGGAVASNEELTALAF